MTQNIEGIPRIGTQRTSSGDRLFLLFIFLFTFSLGLKSSLELGLSWDEANFIPSGVNYVEALLDHVAGRAEGSLPQDPRWQWTWEHPPLVKLASGFSLWLLSPLLGPLVAARLPCLLGLGALPVAAYLLARQTSGRFAGICAALLTATTPRLLGQGVLVELDLPLATFCLLTTAAVLRSIQRQGSCSLPRRILLPGALMGCAFLTKFNAVFLLPPLFLWAGWSDRRRNRVTLIAIGWVGAAIFLLGWPFLWDHPLSKGIGYLTTKIQHDLVPAYYLGKTYSDVPAPWHYPFLTFWATTPSFQLACLFAGWMRCLSGRKGQAGLLPWVVLAFVLPCALPSVGKYDGVRLFLTGIAFSAVMAGIGLAELARRLHRRWGWPLGTLPVCAFALGAAHCLSVYPHFLSYYSDLVGGPSGARNLGFETTYWGESLTPRLFEKAHEEIGIHRLAVAPVGDNVRALSKNMGLLPKDMELVNPEGEPFDALALLCRQGMFSPEDWWLYRHARPLLKIEISGVPLVILVSEDEVQRAQAKRTPMTKDDHR